MKPAFALDFRNDAVTLLHRTPGGWHQVGSTRFDEPDFAEALTYMRSTALGLSPRGIATKLILPDEQILYTTVHAPGPDEASRLAQIRAGLEGRTPYAVDDLVFDYTGTGDELRVAVIARETLAEAEAFAAEHRFNPVSFVAAPDASVFGAEPFFGPSALSASLLAAGEVVEADHEIVTLTARGLPVEEAVAVVAPEPVVEPLPAPEPEPNPMPEPVPEPEPEPEAEPEPLAVPEPEMPEELPPEAEPEPDYWPEEEPEPEFEPAYEPEPAPALPPRSTPIFGLADDEPPPSAGLRRSVEPAPVYDDLPPMDEAPLPADLQAALQEIVLEEAPMALDVEDDSPPAKPLITDPAIADDVPPMPGYTPAMGFASRRASAVDAQAKATPTLRAPIERPSAAKPLPPKVERPVAARPTAQKPAKDGKGLRGLGALVTAPSIPGTKKKKVVAPIAASAAVAEPQAQAAAGSPVAKPAQPARGSLGGIGARPPVRGKPRYLGLILTAILLLLLAIIAAWSTSLAFRDTGDAAVETAVVDETDAPTPEDEMLADLQDPEELAVDPEGEADLVAPATVPEAGTEAAPEDLAAAGSEPTATPAPGAEVQDEIFLATMDKAPEAPDPLALATPEARGDPLPAAQAPPPPFGTVYQFDANGLIVATPEGITTPEGVLVIAGKPPRVPEARPETVTAAAAAAKGTEPVAEATAAPVVSDPALSGFRPKARPEGLAPAENPDDASLAPAADSRFASLRPMARPKAVIAAGEAARQASAAASLTAQAETAEEANASTSKMAVAISRKPAPRPRDLSRAVEAAVAAASRQPDPEPQPEPEPEQPKEKPSKKAAAEADDEPETAAASPRIKQNASVAKQATFKNAINLGKTALIGVYGTPSKRYAMIRTEGGRYKKVKVGDKIDGGKVQAITANEVRYQKGAKLMTLSMPKG